jgi:F0F1-type ATP synthase assembly protein I
MGYGLDKLFHTHFLQWVFLVLGIAAGMIEAIRESQKH